MRKICWPPSQLANALTPDLREAYEKLPPHLASRISELVKVTKQGLTISPDQLVKYAFLVVAVERGLEGKQVSVEHTKRARAEAIGELHGYQLGYDDPKEAQRRSRRGRQARQRVEASVKSVWQAWNKTEKVRQDIWCMCFQEA